MGMFDLDKVTPPDGNLKEFVSAMPDNEFVLHGVIRKGDYVTSRGTAQMTWLQVSALGTTRTSGVKTVGTLSEPIDQGALRAEDSDFPCVVKLMQVGKNNATVLRWVRDGDK